MRKQARNRREVSERGRANSGVPCVGTALGQGTAHPTQTDTQTPYLRCCFRTHSHTQTQPPEHTAQRPPHARHAECTLSNVRPTPTQHPVHAAPHSRSAPARGTHLRLAETLLAGGHVLGRDVVAHERVHELKVGRGRLARLQVSDGLHVADDTPELARAARLLAVQEVEVGARRDRLPAGGERQRRRERERNRGKGRRGTEEGDRGRERERKGDRGRVGEEGKLTGSTESIWKKAPSLHGANLPLFKSTATSNTGRQAC